MVQRVEPSVEEDRIAAEIVDAALKVHRAMGPGLLESVYEACLEHELIQRGLHVERQKPVPVVYDSVELKTGFKLDLLVGGLVIVEVKTVEELAPIHHAQTLTYLRLTGNRLALLINFNVPLLKNGIKRIIL